MPKLFLKILFLIPVNLVLIGISGCSGPEPISEGIIEYQVKYANPDHEILFPETMTLVFKDGKSKATLNAMNFVEISFIFDNESKSIIELSKMLSETTYHILDSTRTSTIYEEGIALEHELSKETKMIAEHKCFKASISRTDNGELYNVYFTKDIGMTDPNWSSPYKGIPGVLLDFRITIHGIEMSLTATHIEKTRIDDSEFAVPEDYTLIEEEEMQEKLRNVIP